MLISTLFKPGTKINPEHRPKYVHILAYASVVSEIYKKVICCEIHYVNIFLKFELPFYESENDFPDRVRENLSAEMS